MTDNQQTPRYRASPQNTRKVERSAFGKLLHEEFLTTYNITQKRLSQVSGVAAEDISRMVTGERYPYDPTLYNNLYALFKALVELGVPLTDDQVNTVLQVKEIHDRLSDTRQEELLNALKDKGVVKVAHQTTQQEASTLYHPAGQTPPVIYEEPPIIDNLPFQQNPFFTGRESQLEQIAQLLQVTDSVTSTQPVIISGLAGIGKTELALEYAHRHYPDVYRTVLWVNADTEALQASYASLTQTLKLPEWNEQDQYRRTQAVTDWLKAHTNWLLIMDNADDLPLAESFLPAKPLGHVVFTTRSLIISTVTSHDRQIELEVMTSEEGLDFLLRRSDRLQDEVAFDAARQVVELLGRLPLALDQAGAYIKETGISFADYIDLYDKQRRDLLDRRELLVGEHSRHPESVVVTFVLCRDKAREQRHLASDILDFCAFLQPDAIPDELFQHDDDFKYGTTVFYDAIAALRRYSLIRRNTEEQTYSMHRLVQAVLIDGMSSELQKQWRERVARALNAAFPEVEFKDWSQCERLLVHALACATWMEDKLTPTVGVARLFHEAGIYLRERGQYLEAELLLVRAISVWELNLGDRCVEAAKSIHHLGILYRRQGKQERVEPLYQQALSIYEQHLGPEHPDIASVLNDLAVLYDDQGKYEKAELLFQQALSIRKKHLGDEHPHTAISLYNLAGVYYIQGKYEQAERLYQQTLTIWKKQLGPEHPYIARCLNSLALLYWRQNEFELAEPLYRQSLAMREKQLGPEHHDTAWTLYRLAQLLQDQGKHEQAEDLYQRALSIQELRLGEKHPYTQQTRKDYVAFLHSIGRYAKAATLEASGDPPV